MERRQQGLGNVMRLGEVTRHGPILAAIHIGTHLLHTPISLPTEAAANFPKQKSNENITNEE